MRRNGWAVLCACALALGGAAHAGPVAKPRVSASTSVRSGPQLVEAVRDLFVALDYDKAYELARAARQRADLSTEDRVELLYMEACAAAVVVGTAEEETTFRSLLRLQPTFEVPLGSSPKISTVFHRVKSEEARIAQTVKEESRRLLMSGLELDGALPARAPGGEPIPLRYVLRDPAGVVDGVRLAYRKNGEGDFSVLALKRGESGSWVGALSGDVTANARGAALEYFVETWDKEGVLVSLGNSAQPLRIDLSPGMRRRKGVPVWVFWTGAAVTAVASAAAVGLRVASSQAQADLNAYSHQSLLPAGIEGETWTQKAARGAALTLWLNVSWIVAVVAAVASGVTLPFVE